MNFSSLDLLILGPAFVAGLLVLSTHVPLGQEVLKRGIIFIDLAIAQIAALGVLAASIAGWKVGGWQVQLTAAVSAVLGGILLHWLEHHFSESLEAMIGVIFILAASTSILLLAGNPHGSDHLQELLVGQILWVSWQQLLPVFLLSLILLVLWFRFRDRFSSDGLNNQGVSGLGFYILFALAVTASIQLVGIYLVFSSLIVPALASKNYKKNSLLIGYSVGIGGYLSGLIVSSVTDLPSGPVIVWMLVVTGLIAGLLTRHKQYAR